MRTSQKTDFRRKNETSARLKITFVDMTYPGQRPELPSLSHHFLSFSLDCWQSVFLLKENGTGHGRSTPYSAILPYHSFVVVLTKHSSKAQRISDPYRKQRLQADYFLRRISFSLEFQRIGIPPGLNVI